jgi:hypothetical protein
LENPPLSDGGQVDSDFVCINNQLANDEAEENNAYVSHCYSKPVSETTDAISCLPVSPTESNQQKLAIVDDSLFTEEELSETKDWSPLSPYEFSFSWTKQEPFFRMIPISTTRSKKIYFANRDQLSLSSHFVHWVLCKQEAIVLDVSESALLCFLENFHFSKRTMAPPSLCELISILPIAVQLRYDNPIWSHGTYFGLKMAISSWVEELRESSGCASVSDIGRIPQWLTHEYARHCKSTEGFRLLEGFSPEGKLLHNTITEIVHKNYSQTDCNFFGRRNTDPMGLMFTAFIEDVKAGAAALLVKDYATAVECQQRIIQTVAYDYFNTGPPNGFTKEQCCMFEFLITKPAFVSIAHWSLVTNATTALLMRQLFKNNSINIIEVFKLAHRYKV